MNQERDEEARLRSAALQNAESIFLARQRAEEELVRTREELRKQSEWLRVTLASIGDGVVTTDIDGKVMFLNGVAATLTGWTQQEAQGRPLSEVFRIVDEESRRPVENPAKRALEEGRSVGLASHTILIAKDGTETPIDDSAAPIRDDNGDTQGVVLIFRSIAARKQTEEALRRSERELTDFFENASVGLRWVGPDGIVLRVNQAELDMLGYSVEEYVGHHIAEFHVDPSVVTDILRRLSAGEAVRDREAAMRCKDGSIKSVLIDSSVLWQEGRFIHTRTFTRDVTDRRRVEEAQAQLAAIVESSFDAIVSKTLDSRIRSWNAGAVHLFGYTAQEAIGQRVTFLMPPDRQGEELVILERLRRGERVEPFETVRVTKDGRRIDVSVTISPIRDGAGHIVGASKIARDITVQKLAEQVLRQSEAQFRQLADALPQIVWTARPDGFIDYYNKRWYEFTDFPRQEGGDQGWKVLLHPDDVQRCEETYNGCIRSGDLYQIEHRFKDHRTDGYRWFLSRAYPVRDEQRRIVRWFGTSTDIDDTKQVEESTRFLADTSAALAELTDYKRTLHSVASLAVPVFADWCAVQLLEADGSISLLTIAHRDPAKAKRAQEIFNRYPPQPSDRHGFTKVLRTGESEWVARIPESMLGEWTQDEEHLRIIRQLGLKSYICTPLRSPTRTLGVLTFVTAESGRVYGVTDLAAAEGLASRAVIAIENASLLAALKESDQRKDEFLAMLAHELRNPLAPIRNAVQIFRGKGPLVPELQWATQVIDRQVNQMTRLVDDLLDVSRITRGKIDLRRERVELASVVSSAVEASRPLVEKSGHELTVTFPPRPILLDADPTRLSQVLSNLLNNAAKYTDPGGRIWLTAERQNDQVLIRVRDTGIGIPTEILPRIFDMFMQVDRSLDRSDGGLGIGLTLVQRLVELHGGTVEARSDGAATGSEFLVRLPIAVEGKSEPQAATGDKEESLPLARRILVVDDNRDAAESLGMLLRMIGNEVETVHDGLEAVAAAATFRPNVVLMDIGLPKLDGYETARRIRERDARHDMLLVALTGWGQDEDRRRSKAAGFDYHLTKPVDFAALKELLVRHLTPRTSSSRDE